MDNFFSKELLVLEGSNDLISDDIINERRPHRGGITPDSLPESVQGDEQKCRVANLSYIRSDQSRYQPEDRAKARRLVGRSSLNIIKLIKCRDDPLSYLAAVIQHQMKRQ